MKTCRKCGESKSLARFPRDAAYPDGHRARCKDCRREEHRAWKAANKERDRELWRRWRAKQPKGTLPHQREWYKAQDPEMLRADRRAWKQANREKNREISRRSYAKDLERSRTRAREAAHRRRESLGGRVDPDELAALVARPCAYCGSPEHIEIDHIAPLSRGGKHEPENLAPACRSCNRSKGAKLLSEWKVAA